MYYIGIDIGSTASKVCVLPPEAKQKSPVSVMRCFVLPTGWSSKVTSATIKENLAEYLSSEEGCKTVATGYGRISVDYADKVITEITCHARGGYELAGEDCSVIDIGGQDTKFIHVKGGRAVDFLMNDKCAAGTGKFIEVMANRLGVTIEELLDLAQEGYRNGSPVSISSLCTVFAESEVINYMGEGRTREDLAAGIIQSVALKVATLVQRRELQDNVILTGGLSQSEFLASLLSEELKTPVKPMENGRFAGALGAALLAKEKLG